MYKVIRGFHDLQDATKTKNGNVYREYKVGDIFPRKGLEVSEERLKELAGSENKQGMPLIELVEERSKKNNAPEKSRTTKKTAVKDTANTTEK